MKLEQRKNKNYLRQKINYNNIIKSWRYFHTNETVNT